MKSALQKVFVTPFPSIAYFEIGLMAISSYLCWVIGQSKEKTLHLHSATTSRIKASAIAIHIPVFLWFVTGYSVAKLVFEQDLIPAIVIAFACAAIIYSVERLVLLSPPSRVITTVRLFIGVVIAALGTFTIDLVVFDREVNSQLRENAKQQVSKQYESKLEAQRTTIDTKKKDWQDASQAAACEANGTCGSRIRTLGPIYRELKAKAERAEEQYLQAERDLALLIKERDEALLQVENDTELMANAGLLDRATALHQRIMENGMALMVFSLFFVLVFSLEMMVLSVKWLFDETVDDKIEKIQANIRQRKAEDYETAILSPVAEAKLFAERSIGVILVPGQDSKSHPPW